MIIRARDLSLRRGNRDIARGLTFAVGSGEALILTGPNGAGKTTLLRTLAGYLSPGGGTIEVEPALDDGDIGACAHYVGHLNAVKPQLTALENLLFWAHYLGGQRSLKRCLDALARLGLAGLEEIPAADFSAGQKRRLCLARLLVAPRDIWLLDEPTTSLDRDGQQALAGVVTAHCAAGGIAIAATHLDLGIAGARELVLGGAKGVAA